MEMLSSSNLVTKTMPCQSLFLIISLPLQKLFKKVIAWHCLGCIWGKNKKEGRASSVKATVDQFNAVSLRVTSSILASSRSKSSGANMRGKLISWWISVAQVRIILIN